MQDYQQITNEYWNIKFKHVYETVKKHLVTL